MRVVLLAVVVASMALAVSAVNERPIIGIFSQPTFYPLTEYGNAYIAASYVKYVESAGARAVPINFTAPVDELTDLFYSLNGVLFPGGGWNINGTVWGDAAQLFFDLAKEANDNGDYFPVWGTCWGFQVLSMLGANNDSVLGPTNTENISYPLNFIGDPTTTRMFANAPTDIIDILANNNVTMNNHMYSLYKNTFYSNAALQKFFTPISTNIGRDGIEFISTMEAIDYPIYASQWHPEKVIFEWNPVEAMNHSTDAVKAMQYMADFFVTEARKSTHSFNSSAAESAALIYNYDPMYTEALSPSFEQCYLWTYPNDYSTSSYTPIGGKHCG